MYDKRMKLTSALFFLSATAIAPLYAQTTTTPKPAARPAGSTAVRPAVSACAKLPELSSKIPALAPGLPCAKHLYTITTIPTVKLENVSPLEGPTLKTALGIESTSFSLDYIDTKVGTGELAGAHSWYSLHYTGYLTDGTKFDSSIDRGEPLTIQYGMHQVILGWDTGLAGMRVGGKRRLFIPFQLAYGTNPPPQSHIPPRSELIFDVELVNISETPPPVKPAPAAPPSATRPSPAASPTGAQPAPAAPPPGTATKPTPPPANPANPTTVPPPTDPTKPTAAPPPSTPSKP